MNKLNDYLSKVYELGRNADAYLKIELNNERKFDISHYQIDFHKDHRKITTYESDIESIETAHKIAEAIVKTYLELEGDVDTFDYYGQ